MPLESVIADKAAIPQGLESYYVEKDGKFVLDVTGMKTQVDFDAYAEALKKRFTDGAADFSKANGGPLTRDEILAHVDAALEKFRKASPDGDNGGGKGNGKNDGDQGGGDIAARLHDLERNVSSLTDSNAKLTQERDDAIGHSKDTTIRNTLTEAAGKAGATPDGVRNLVTLTEQNFEVTQDGTVVTKLDAKSGTPNQNADDFFSNAARQKEFRMFWPPSKGAGADNDGGGGGGGDGGDLGAGNPWSKAGWNMTKQGSMLVANRAEADRLMTAAGVKLGAVAANR
jgi:hypothetical protein